MHEKPEANAADQIGHGKEAKNDNCLATVEPGLRILTVTLVHGLWSGEDRPCELHRALVLP